MVWSYQQLPTAMPLPLPLRSESQTAALLPAGGDRDTWSIPTSGQHPAPASIAPTLSLLPLLLSSVTIFDYPNYHALPLCHSERCRAGHRATPWECVRACARESLETVCGTCGPRRERYSSWPEELWYPVPEGVWGVLTYSAGYCVPG